MENFSPAVDAYIAKAADFAQPIMNHLRKLIHQACPEIEEGLKWSMPFFDYQGPVCQIAAFKEHMAFGFWKVRLLSDPHKVLKLDDEKSAAGSFGRITTLADLPADEILIAYIKEAVQLNKDGVKPVAKPKATVPKQVLTTPDEFNTLLDSIANAKLNFHNFSPSKQREYLEWFADAKTEATRQKRMEQAVEWIAEGKSRHWKYQT